MFQYGLFSAIKVHVKCDVNRGIIGLWTSNINIPSEILRYFCTKCHWRTESKDFKNLFCFTLINPTPVFSFQYPPRDMADTMLFSDKETSLVGSTRNEKRSIVMRMKALIPKKLNLTISESLWGALLGSLEDPNRISRWSTELSAGSVFIFWCLMLAQRSNIDHKTFIKSTSH